MSVKQPAASKAAPKSRKRTPRKSKADSALSKLTTALEGLQRPTAVMGEPVVGVRNISNYTIGVRSPFQDEPDLSLSGAHYDPEDPTREIPVAERVGQISHKWWLQLRQGPLVRKGMIVRDDTVISQGMVRSPVDLPSEVPATFAVNAIFDPFQWIESKEEAELKDAIKAITAEESLRRLLTAVNQKIEAIRLTIDPNDDKRETEALRQLPWRYRITEELVLERLESEFYAREV